MNCIKKYRLYFLLPYIIILAGCINNEKNKEIIYDEKLDFNTIMDSIKQLDLINVYRDIEYNGPYRNGKMNSINYSDSTEAIYNFVGVEYFKIMRKGQNHLISDNELKGMVKYNFNLLKRLGINSLSYSSKYQTMKFVLNLENINPETLPKHTVLKDAKLYNEGVVMYSYDGQFETSTIFKNFGPTKIAPNWYFYIQ